MNIDSNNFRDGALTQITIGYDWVDSSHYALISVQKDHSISTYRIAGLSKYYLYEDFQCMAIDQCKFIDDADGLYLSLDPYIELAPREEQDCLCFWGASISLEKG